MDEIVDIERFNEDTNYSAYYKQKLIGALYQYWVGLDKWRNSNNETQN